MEQVEVGLCGRHTFTSHFSIHALRLDSPSRLLASSACGIANNAFLCTPPPPLSACSSSRTSRLSSPPGCQSTPGAAPPAQ